MVRRNPFNKAESSEDELIQIKVPSTHMTADSNISSAALTSDAVILGSEINQHNDSECLIGGGKLGILTL